jgi:hypothetical protein
LNSGCRDFRWFEEEWVSVVLRIEISLLSFQVIRNGETLCERAIKPA